MLRSDLCNYYDAFIVVKGTIDFLAVAANEDDKAEKDVAVKNNTPFRSCIPKINSTLTHNSKDLDIFVPMYDLLEYSHNYSMTSRSLWNYYRDEIDEVGYNALDGKSFEYKPKIVRETPGRPPQPGRCKPTTTTTTTSTILKH